MTPLERQARILELVRGCEGRALPFYQHRLQETLGLHPQSTEATYPQVRYALDRLAREGAVAVRGTAPPLYYLNAEGVQRGLDSQMASLVVKYGIERVTARLEELAEAQGRG